MITLRDLFKYGKGYILRKDPVSLYRYIEHLIQIAIVRKYRTSRILEIGPGTDPVFEYLDAKAYKTATIVDYNPKIIEVCKQKLSDREVEYHLIDVEESQEMTALVGEWDCVVANGVLEHVRDDPGLVKHIHDRLRPGGITMCTTVLHHWLFNDWDHAVGHYRRYTVAELRHLFRDYSDVQIIQSSILQELARSLFMKRIRHLTKNTVEENNMLFGEGFSEFGRPPYAPIFWLIRYILPFYLLVDWAQRNVLGGIVFVVARK